uniref:Dual serine/threonine and tyrosine protein kinase-like n=1 Tax=Diabrotica virgifera virgifera TaxID=50390 RepID=A0A6P7GML4_DIAVI
MVDIPKEFKRYAKHCNSLKHIIQDTQDSFQEIYASLHIHEKDEWKLDQTDIEMIRPKLDRVPTLFIFGQNCHSKALFVNALLGQAILPLFSSQWRWVSNCSSNFNERVKELFLTVISYKKIREKPDGS